MQVKEILHNSNNCMRRWCFELEMMKQHQTGFSSTIIYICTIKNREIKDRKKKLEKAKKRTRGEIEEEVRATEKVRSSMVIFSPIVLNAAHLEE